MSWVYRLPLPFKRFVRRITHRIWNEQVFLILSYAKEKGHINSNQFHVLHSYFDPTQNHRINK